MGEELSGVSQVQQQEQQQDQQQQMAPEVQVTQEGNQQPQ